MSDDIRRSTSDSGGDQRDQHLVEVKRVSYDMLSKEEILKHMDTDWAGREVVYFDLTDSTNTQAKMLGENGAPHGTLVIADMQEGGKGRRGRNWVSPSGEGIWMSLLLRPEMSAVNASMLTLVMALATEKGIRETTGLCSMIKWPNDLVLNKKKICGILTEMATDQMEIKYVIIGTGINVCQTEFPEDIKATATSLYLESGEKISRSKIVAGIMKAFEEYYEKFMETEDLSSLIEEYNEKLVNRDSEVCILAPTGDFRGISTGINKTGGLMVRLEDGSETEVISGEVSVRGVYGYV